MSSRVVAWVNNGEWMEVYNKLFYGTFEEQHDALDIINVWQIRFAERIPVAIEATYVLMEAWLKHTTLTESAQKLLFSSAVMQFVGLITERGLKGNVRKPIHFVGIELDIPEWIINLRHEMAHGPLPSKLMLSKAVLFGLDWLKDKHWDMHFRIMQNSQAVNSKLKSTDIAVINHENIEEIEISKCELSSDFLQFLKTFMELSHEVSNRNKSQRFEANHVADKITSKVLKCPGSLDYLCKIFIEGNFLSYQPNNDSQFEKDSTEVFQLTEKCIAFWKPIFHIFRNNAGFTKLLLHIAMQLFHLNVDINHASNLKISPIYYAYVEWASYFVDCLTSLYGPNLESIDMKSSAILKKCLKILHLNSDEFSKLIILKLESVVVGGDYLEPATSVDAMITDEYVIHSIDDLSLVKSSDSENKSSSDFDMNAVGGNSYEDSKILSNGFGSYLGLGSDQTCNSLTESLFGIESKTDPENSEEVVENVRLETNVTTFKQTVYNKIKGGEKVPNMFDSFSPENWTTILDSV